MSCPLHHTGGCDCRFVVEGLLLTGLVCAGAAWLVADRVIWKARRLFG
jgi:hypothetical protein